MENVKTFLRVMKIFGTPATKGMILEFNEDGEIIRSLQDKEGKVIARASEVSCSKGVLYIGSYEDNFIGQLFLKRLPPKSSPLYQLAQ